MFFQPLNKHKLECNSYLSLRKGVKGARVNVAGLDRDGVVDQAVDRAELPLDFLGHRCTLLLARDVDFERDGTARRKTAAKHNQRAQSFLQMPATTARCSSAAPAASLQ